MLHKNKSLVGARTRDSNFLVVTRPFPSTSTPATRLDHREAGIIVVNGCIAVSFLNCHRHHLPRGEWLAVDKAVAPANNIKCPVSYTPGLGCAGMGLRAGTRGVEHRMVYIRLSLIHI